MASLPSCQNYEKTQTFSSFTMQNPKQTTTHYFASLPLLSQPLYLTDPSWTWWLEVFSRSSSQAPIRGKDPDSRVAQILSF